MSKNDNRKNLYLLGQPFGFTPQVFYELVHGLGKGDFKGVNKGEFFNYKNVKGTTNKDHNYLKKKYEEGKNRYWSKDFQKIEINFLEMIDEYTLSFIIFRDTVQPRTFYRFFKNKSKDKNGLIVKADSEYIVEKLENKEIYFPTNLIGYEETRDALEESIEKCNEIYDSIYSNNKNVEKIKIEKFFDDPKKVLDIVRDLGYDVKSRRYKNHLGKKVKKYKKEYNRV